MTGEDPAVSIVIPVYNARKTLVKCLDAISKLDYPDYEVIVVDDGSTDGSAELCEAYWNVRVIRLDRGGPSRARNAGIEAARGELTAFTDGDCIVDRQWLRELAKGFQSPEIAGVGGDQKSPDDETPTGRTIQDFFKAIGFMTGYIKTRAQMTETDHNPSCNSVYPKALLQGLGGFNESLWPGEDVDLDYRIRRLGYKLMYNPAAVVGHYRPDDYRGLWRMMQRYGACQFHLIRMYGPFRALHYAPAALVVGLLAAAGTLVIAPWLWPVLLVPLAAMLGWFYWKSRGWRKTFVYCAMLILTLSAWHWGFFGAWKSRPLSPSRPSGER
jgi:cellulose synthase/poly-beta-1,6-N-acetylglucosamine synthase-like glycosyltransferase